MSTFIALFSFDFFSLGIPAPVAIAAVAVIGYLVGRRTRATTSDVDFQSRREIKRAHAVAKDLEKITRDMRRSLTKHHSSVARFKDRVAELGGSQDEAAWKDLCKEAEGILGPTLQLAAQIAHAYDEIRRQSNHLMTFTEVRTDPLTGVCNRRAMDETLNSLVAMKNRYDAFFSLGMFDIDHFKKVNDEQGHLAGDEALQKVAKLMDECVRETDIVTRYGGEEFVILMPQTELEGACLFSERLRRTIEQRLGLTVSAGVAAALEGETPQQLLQRADAAMYSAKTAGRNKVYRHDGSEIELVGAEMVEAK